MKLTLQEQGLELVKEHVAEGGTSRVHQVRVGSPSSPFGPIGTALALKEYKSSALEAAGQAERVRQEAELTAKVSHPNIVKSFGILPSSEPGTVLHVLEWIEGPTLQSWVKASQGTALRWQKVHAVAVGVLDGLEALHSSSVLHRDLKSENVLMANDIPKITDLGIAEVHFDDSATMHTQVKDFIGSIRFASPQFVRGEKFAIEDDTYGYGTILFELCTGAQVYDEVIRKTLLTAEILTRPPKIPALLDDVPGPLRTVLEGTLHPTRKRRPTLSQLREALATPTSSPYIQSELDAQSKDRRGYEVVSAQGDGSSVFVDLRGDAEFSGTDEVWHIVRRTTAINVPSAGGAIEAEEWIADVHVKHAFGGIAHCITVARRWHADPSASGRSRTLDMFGSFGRLAYDDPKNSRIKVGDLLVKP